MLLFRKMLHYKEGSWLACVSAEKLTEVRLCSVRASQLTSSFAVSSLPARRREADAFEREPHGRSGTSDSGFRHVRVTDRSFHTGGALSAVALANPRPVE
jgi:hypothetical protein